MPTLATDLRNKLERVVIEARDVSEAGSRAALEALAVNHFEPYPHMKPAQRELRNHLRARARQLGDRQDASGRLTVDHLVGECAYEHWHRMLFARFLAENNLLIEPQECMAISLEEAEELANEEGVNVWVFASRCAQGMLPQIFRPDDPLLQVSFATEHRIKLENLLSSLPQVVFTASDSLGWVYQFWQSKKKDEVNRSEVKIGADEISAVTQLFTEPYMVEFLLHNTIGAWWAGKKLTTHDLRNATSEEELRRKIALPGVKWEYLRFVRDSSGVWRPAAGTFNGWPEIVRELKVLDPCCGSGHFLVAAFYILVVMRKAEERLSAAEAVEAVLRDNLHGLEIEDRCCQIAAFALALAAWAYPDGGGYRVLPALHIACTGFGPQSTEEQWVKLAEQSSIPMRTDERQRIKNGLLNLHRLFSQAPTLGSLINPAELPADLIAADYETIQPYLAAIMSAEKADDETRERATAAAGMVKAADLIAGKYTLVITNVPYLGRGKQDDTLREHVEQHYRLGVADLATAFVLRSAEFSAKAGSIALVTPQNWFSLLAYRALRKHLLETMQWNLVARLGPGAFNTISGHVVNISLVAMTAMAPRDGHLMISIDASPATRPEDKARMLRGQKSGTLAGGKSNDTIGEALPIAQAVQNRNKDCVIRSEPPSTSVLLEKYVSALSGVSTGALDRFSRVFWEVDKHGETWEFIQSSVDEAKPYGGRANIIFWERGQGSLFEYAKSVRHLNHAAQNWQRGKPNWGKLGVCLSKMSDLKASLYDGNIYDENCCAIIPFDDQLLIPLWCFCSSSAYSEEVRKINQSVLVQTKYMIKVPFDLGHWQQVAAEKYPSGLPEPESDDPTQWLFHGWPEESIAPLHVAIARLLGYRWPAELDDNMRLSKRARMLVKRCSELAKFADQNGIVCIPSVRGEEPAAERLTALLAAAGINPTKARELAGGTDLDDWLRNSFFEEHCKLFHDRPFVWHIWDGRKRDGFHALVNYHKLAEGGGKGRKLLESITYSYLGEWISRQKDGVKRGEGGAEDRLAAALELQKRLEAILQGEPPFDIFVRWKPLGEQPIGWETDINDGVRLNIRPFLASDLPNGRKNAGILRYKPNIKWGKDRGKEPQRSKAEFPWFWGWDEKAGDFIGAGKEPDGNRWNDCHYTNKAKQAARDVERTRQK